MDTKNEKYAGKTLDELKAVLRSRKLKISVKKKVLVERLVFDDINSKQDEPEPEYRMDLPDATLYRDLHDGHRQSFPNVTLGRILDFFASCDKKSDPKIEHLYNEKYLRYVRSCQQSGRTFVNVTGVVWAEMKKAVSYKIDVALSPDGVVMESQCECAVGQGPSAHCKHVGCLLFALHRFSATGDVLTEVTCTQVLQKFHKPRPHKDSPVKTSQLAELRGKDRPMLYDPRPLKRRNRQKIEERLRNVAMNWGGKTRLPLLQKYSPANIKALCLDHDYLKLSPEDQFLKESQVSHITEEQVTNIEACTKGQRTSGRWRDERVKRITASNFGSVCKMTERRDISLLVNNLTSTKQIASQSLSHGIKFEDVAVSEYEAQTGTTATRCGLFVSRSKPMLAATPDRILDENTIMEVKCPYSVRNQAISERTLPYLISTHGQLSLKESHDYYFQVQGQLFCTERKMCKFVVYTFKGLTAIDVPFNDEFVTKMLLKLDNFYTEYFKPAILSKFLYKNSHHYDFSKST